MKRTKSYSRKSAHKSSNLIIIFCEGEDTEPAYFKPFCKEDSRLKVKLYPPDKSHPNNSPRGLYLRAKRYKQENDLRNDDSIWFVFDSDYNDLEELKKVRQMAEEQKFHIAQSNPCFELWIYYHYASSVPKNAPTSQIGWKGYLYNQISGGWKAETCHQKVKQAIELAGSIFQADRDGIPKLYSTECYKLLEDILQLQDGWC